MTVVIIASPGGLSTITDKKGGVSIEYAIFPALLHISKGAVSPLNTPFFQHCSTYQKGGVSMKYTNWEITRYHCQVLCSTFLRQRSQFRRPSYWEEV
jgi:hypothetical protein